MVIGRQPPFPSSSPGTAGFPLFFPVMVGLDPTIQGTENVWIPRGNDKREERNDKREEVSHVIPLTGLRLKRLILQAQRKKRERTLDYLRSATLSAASAASKAESAASEA